MKIVWRNPNRIMPKVISIAKAGSVEQSGALQVLYRSSTGAGILGTLFEVRINSSKVPRVA